MTNFSQITGADKVAKALEKLPRSLRNKAVRPAMRAAMKPVRDRIVSNIQSDLTDIATHTLEKNIVIRAAKTKNKTDLRVKVQIASKKINPKNQQRLGLYGSVREFGKKGQPPKPSFRTGARDAAPQAINIFFNTMKVNLGAVIQDAKL